MRVFLVKVSFRFDAKTNATGLGEDEQVLEARHPLAREFSTEPASGVEARDIGPVGAADQAPAIGRAVKARSVKHQRNTITAEAQVGLDHFRAQVDGEHIGGARLLRRPDLEPALSNEPQSNLLPQK